jgi:hypothetical protein
MIGVVNSHQVLSQQSLPGFDEANGYRNLQCERKQSNMRNPSVARTTRRFAGTLTAACLGVLGMGGGVGNATAAPPQPTTDGVSAILLDAYDGCFVADAWLDLNSNWPEYGSIPVSITTGGDLCTGNFTLGDLESSGADTVILDSTAYSWALTPADLQALQAYADEGHTVIGEDTIFQWKTRQSNNGLAPLFGLAEQPTWYIDGLQGMSPTYRLNEQDPDAGVLLRDVPNPYVSSLYGRGQKPAHKKWRTNVLAGARYIGRTQDKRNAITVYDGPGYTAIYISSQAALRSTPDDLQFLYNAIVYPNEG